MACMCFAASSCAARGFRGVSVPSTGANVVLNDVPWRCNLVPSAEQVEEAYDSDLQGNYYFISADPDHDRTIAMDMCAQRNDPIVEAYLDFGIQVYPGAPRQRCWVANIARMAYKQCLEVC